MGGKHVDISNGSKLCPKCGETKLLEAFGKNKYSANGYSSYCKPCGASSARAYRATPEGKAAHRAATEHWIAGLNFAPDLEGTKPCPRCKIEKTFNQYPRNKRSKHGIGSYCLECSSAIVRERRSTPEGAEVHRAASRRWRENNAERHADNNAKRTYGVDHGTYNAMLAAQEGKCAICKTPEGDIRLAFDHCHAEGHVRGLLCSNCNNGLGRFKDRVEFLLNAARYLISRRSC